MNAIIRASSFAPVCPTSRDQPVPGQFGPIIPAITPALDLPSAIRALNQISLVLSRAPANNLAPAIPVNLHGAASPSVDTGGGGGKQPKNHFTEVDRATAKIRVSDPDDHNDPPINAVIWERITMLKFRNKAGTEELVWYL